MSPDSEVTLDLYLPVRVSYLRGEKAARNLYLILSSTLPQELRPTHCGICESPIDLATFPNFYALWTHGHSSPGIAGFHMLERMETRWPNCKLPVLSITIADSKGGTPDYPEVPTRAVMIMSVLLAGPMKKRNREYHRTIMVSISKAVAALTGIRVGYSSIADESVELFWYRDSIGALTHYGPPISYGLHDIWWMNILGPEYVSVIGKDKLQRLPFIERIELEDGGVLLINRNDPLSWNTEAMLRTKAVVRSALGEDLFWNKRNPYLPARVPSFVDRTEIQPGV